MLIRLQLIITFLLNHPKALCTKVGMLVEGNIGAMFPYIILFVRSGVLAKYDSLKIRLCNHVARLLIKLQLIITFLLNQPTALAQ